MAWHIFIGKLRSEPDALLFVTMLPGYMPEADTEDTISDALRRRDGLPIEVFFMLKSSFVSPLDWNSLFCGEYQVLTVKKLTDSSVEVAVSEKESVIAHFEYQGSFAAVTELQRMEEFEDAEIIGRAVNLIYGDGSFITQRERYAHA